MEIDEKKLRLYKFLIKEKRIIIDEIPEPYKAEVQKSILY